MENEQIKQKFPIGIILILIFISWNVANLLMSISKISSPFQLKQILFLFSSVGEVGAMIIKIILNLVLIGILGTIFYGIIKRLRWARKLAIYWYIFSIVLSLIDIILLGIITFGALISPLIISIFVFSLIVRLIIIIYLIKKKFFFVN